MTKPFVNLGIRHLRSPIINHLFIVVSRLRMKTRDVVPWLLFVIINYWLKFYNVDWEQNNKLLTLKYCSSAKEKKVYKNILWKNYKYFYYFLSQNILIIKQNAVILAWFLQTPTDSVVSCRRPKKNFLSNWKKSYKLLVLPTNKE